MPRLPDSSLAPNVEGIDRTESRVVSVNMSGKLDEGETLTGTPVVEEVGTADLDITLEQVSSADLIINGVTVPAGLAVQALVDAQNGKLYKSYLLRVLCDTTGSQTVVGYVRVEVEF